jgi:hypothetical protein
LECKDKTEFTTTAAREDLDSRTSLKSDGLSLTVMTPIFNLTELIWSWQSKTNPNEPKIDIEGLVKIDGKVT